MAAFQTPTDAPNELKHESLQISLTFVRTGPTTGRLSWNIPAPTSGCDIDTLSYNGMILTFDTVTASLSTTPTNTIIYTGDQTASVTLHAGDKIGTALVVAAIYDDKVSTEVDITDIPPNTPIYFSGYPVDKQLRYYRGGVHAYSLPYGAEGPNRREDLPAFQQVLLGYIDNSSLFDINLFSNGEQSTGANASDPTNLTLATLYAFNIFFDANDKVGQTVTIDGTDAQTYGDLVDAINIQLRQLDSIPQYAGRPNANGIYLNVAQKQVYQWNGDEHIAKDTISYPTDPSVIALNEYWFKPSTEIIKQWNGLSWAIKNYIISNVNPSTQLSQSTYWYDNTLIHKWNGVVWCDVPTYAQESNPALATYPVAGSYWFNTDTDLLYEWDTTCNEWKSVEAIHDPFDPDLITNGNYWFEPDTNKLYLRSGGVWILYTDPIVISITAPTSPTLNMAWFNPSTDELQIYGGLGWAAAVVIVYHLDPTDRTSCQLWWNSTTDQMFVWTFSSPNGWVLVNSFVQQTNDPAEIPTLEIGTGWFVPSTQKLFIWDGIDWIETAVMVKTNSPNLPSVGDIWYKADTKVWHEWTGTWTVITPFISEFDRNAITVGQYWHNTITNAVSVCVVPSPAVSWFLVVSQITPFTPAVGYRYYDTLAQELYEWTIQGWIVGVPTARVLLNPQGNMVFIAGLKGSQSIVFVEDVSLFDNLATQTKILRMEFGKDAVPNQQSYAVEGIGLTTSVVERRSVHQYIREYLGEPDITVELSQEQIEQCIRKALEEFRLRSSSAYKRAFFFLQIIPGKQIYELSNKIVGFNKITNVMAAYRIQSSFLGNATGQGAYGQAMLQHLYQMGSFDLISYHIMSDYVELMNMMFAANLAFHFDEDTRILYFHQTFGSNEKVLLDVMIERTEQDIMKDRMTKVWIERYALGKAMLMLSEKRGKYASLPGAGGGVSLNAADLKTTGQELLDRCFSEIDDYIANQIENVGFGADFNMG